MHDGVGGAGVDGAGADSGRTGFRHELYPYEGDGQFLSGAAAFIDDALAGGEVVVVAVGKPKERMLRDQLAGTGAEAGVSFLDLDALGRNPGRLIPAWQDQIARLASGGQAVRGIGESPWGGPDAALAGELRYHEWLLNRAFEQSPAWWLLCPYDTATLETAVLEAAGRCHPLVLAGGAHESNSGYVDEPYTFDQLDAPCDPHVVLPYRQGDLAAVRAKVTACAAEHELGGDRLRELLVAATEVASNSIRHGGGTGTLRTWATESWFICEFHDAGYIQNALVGRVRPRPDQAGGHGMWLVQQLCDLVQIRSNPQDGTTIRLYMALT